MLAVVIVTFIVGFIMGRSSMLASVKRAAERTAGKR